MVAGRVASIAHLVPPGAPTPRTVGEATAQLVAAFDEVVARGVDTRARMALSIDCLDDPELHALLTTDSPIRRTILDQAERLLEGLGVPEPRERAIDLIAIMNGLFFDRLIGHGARGRPADAGAVLGAWLAGVAAARA
ncbi:hypothetical protein GCG21_14730 [Pseudactinotalea sp. HY160]|nr:hypothetical protein [Pseudactinotalea sp. HY160]MPV51237.1 hypothetical protein [Pseudactinotalea sp. HY160]QGH69680.1 hypothetical protein GCE65_09275 [Pseudactinotalea sp. HY158]